MKRYSLIKHKLYEDLEYWEDNCTWEEMEEKKYGDYVKWDDVEQLVDENKNLQSRVNFLSKVIDNEINIFNVALKMLREEEPFKFLKELSDKDSESIYKMAIECAEVIGRSEDK